MKNTENPKRRKTFATRGGGGAERAVTRERPSGRVTIVRSERYSDQRRVAWPSPGVASRSEPPPSGSKQRAGSARNALAGASRRAGTGARRVARDAQGAWPRGDAFGGARWMGRKTYLVDETVRRAVYKGLARPRRRAFERHFFANPRTAKPQKPPRATRRASFSIRRSSVFSSFLRKSYGTLNHATSTYIRAHSPYSSPGSFAP